MVVATPVKMTLEAYLNHDDGTDTRYELVDGVLVAMPTESPLNALIARFLLVHFVQMGLPIDRVGDKQQIAVNSTKVTSREPDLTVHSEASAAAILAHGFLAFGMPMPELAIEVVSPGNEDSENYKRDYEYKAKEYAGCPIPEYWIIDPERAVVWVLVLEGGEYGRSAFRTTQRIVSPTFPALNLTAQQILAAGR